MSIVNVSDFKGKNTIAQTEQANVASVVQAYIDRLEPEYLRKVLGVTLYDLYNAGIIANDAKYLAIKNGANYTDSYGDVVYYEGLKQPILNYIYFHYLKNNTTATTGSGEKTIQKAEAAAALDKEVRAYNDMVTVNKQLHGYLYSKQIKVSWKYSEMFEYENTLGL